MFQLRSKLMANFSTPPGPGPLDDSGPMEIEESLDLAPGGAEYYVFDITEKSVLQITVRSGVSLEISLSDVSLEPPAIGRKFFAVTASRAVCQFGAPYTGVLMVTLLNLDSAPATGSLILKVLVPETGSL